ncbi:protein phosphatase [Acrasis kona]|uniref:Protein phosphatase n=1 Tax=Acrasis kona TaxID=1008807 RepID=A0AAW2YVN1_9EUKA
MNSLFRTGGIHDGTKTIIIPRNSKPSIATSRQTTKNEKNLSPEKLIEIVNKKYPSLNIRLIGGRNLVAKDRNGFSDPFVVFKLGSLTLKSSVCYKTLSPDWSYETFHFSCNAMSAEYETLFIEVWDKDFLDKDFLGRVSIKITELRRDSPTVQTVKLQDIESGEITLELTAHNFGVINTNELRPKHVVVGQTIQAIRKSHPTLEVHLISGSDLIIRDTKYSDPYVKFKLGSTKIKSAAKKKNLNPVWNERFQFSVGVDNKNHPLNHLEIEVWDKDFFKDEFMGRTSVDLNSLHLNTSQKFKLNLEGVDKGTLTLVLTAQHFGIATDSNNEAAYGLCSVQGLRPTMEDEHSAILNCTTPQPHMFFAVYDGHGGNQVSKMLSKRFHEHILTQMNHAPSWMYEDSEIVDAFCSFDKMYCSQMLDGSTAVTVTLQKKNISGHWDIMCASVGDSSAVLYNNGNITLLSQKHNVVMQSEKERVLAAKCLVEGTRIITKVRDCSLAMTRSFGDSSFKMDKSLPYEKQAVHAVPHIMRAEVDLNKVERNSGNVFLIIACDGIWDVMTESEACLFVKEKLDKQKPRQGQEFDLESICHDLSDRCLHSQDNITALIVLLK